MTTLVKRCVDVEREEVVVYVDKYKALKRKLLAVPGVKSVKQARDPVAYLRVTIMATAFYARTAFQDIFQPPFSSALGCRSSRFSRFCRRRCCRCCCSCCCYQSGVCAGGRAYSVGKD